MHHVITYFTGGLQFSIPNELWLTYILKVVKYLFASFVISVYFSMPYTVLTMAIAVLLADFKFYLEVQNYLDLLLDEEDSE